MYIASIFSTNVLEESSLEIQKRFLVMHIETEQNLIPFYHHQ